MRVGVCLVLSLTVCGCGARSRVVDVSPNAAGIPQTPAPIDRGPQHLESLEAYFKQVGQKVAESPRPEKVRAADAESTNPRLAAALAAATTSPSPASYRAVAWEYARLGVGDKAHEYLENALMLEPRDSATYDALARLWRNGGFADRALSDAYRAVYYAPASAAAHNTLGTIFQALGRHKDARRQYERAVQLDPAAAYAYTNLCYAWILEREPGKAEPACQRALALEPTLRAARNNLALAYAASGNIAAARAAFDATGDAATAQYNLGIVQLARRQYKDAVTAFAKAQQIRPEWRQAAVRARQAEKLASTGAEE